MPELKWFNLIFCSCHFSWLVLLILFEAVLCICRSLTCWGIVLGLLGFISSRIWFTSFVPAWWDSWSNTVVIAVSAVATVDKIFSGENFVWCFVIVNVCATAKHCYVHVIFLTIYITTLFCNINVIISKWVWK